MSLFSQMDFVKSKKIMDKNPATKACTRIRLTRN